jgi:IS5 family transposase
MAARDYEDMTVLRRLLAEERADEAYRDMYEQIEDEQRAEWAEQFDSIPYKPNGNEIHRLAMKRLQDD